MKRSCDCVTKEEASPSSSDSDATKLLPEEKKPKVENVAKETTATLTAEKPAKDEKEENDNELHLVSLECLDEKGIKELAAVAADPEVMKFIGNRRPWDEVKVRELVDGAIGDKDIPAHKRDYFSWAVVSRSSGVMGLVALRPTKDRAFPGLQFRIFVGKNTQRRGVGSEALRLMFREYKRRLDESFGNGKEHEYAIFAFSRMDNAAASKCFTKSGMTLAGTKRFGREVENAWKIVF